MARKKRDHWEEDAPENPELERLIEAFGKGLQQLPDEAYQIIIDKIESGELSYGKIGEELERMSRGPQNN